MAILMGWVIGIRRWLHDVGWLRTTHPGVPVVVVGNLYVGGTGKTPLTCELAHVLKTAGWRPGLVSRGYGSRRKAQPAVGVGAHLDWREFGDEPALIAQKTGIPVAVHPNRALAAQSLKRFDPEVNLILCDDGLQHYSLARDLELLVEDARGLGNRLLLPAGPLREPARRRQQVDALFLRDCEPVAGHLAGIPVFGFSVEVVDFFCPAIAESQTVESMAAWCQRQPNTLAVAGIGVPERFFDTLTGLGIVVRHTRALGDHQPLEAHEIASLSATTILMTEKDAIKCQGQLDPRCWVARTRVRWAQAQGPDWIKAQAARLTATDVQHVSESR